MQDFFHQQYESQFPWSFLQRIPVCCWRSPWPCRWIRMPKMCRTRGTCPQLRHQRHPCGTQRTRRSNWAWDVSVFCWKKQWISWISYIYGSKNRICPTFRDFWMFFGCSFFASDTTDLRKRLPWSPMTAWNWRLSRRRWVLEMGSGNPSNCQVTREKGWFTLKKWWVLLTFSDNPNIWLTVNCFGQTSCRIQS